jgi:hypothetical protein
MSQTPDKPSDKPLRLFRYSGNKAALVPLYRRPPPGSRRIVEPFLGSGAYTLNTGLPGLGFDMDPKVARLWWWLQSSAAPDALPEMAARLAEARRGGEERSDILALAKGMDLGAALYLKVNICGLMVGNWSAKTTYPQHRLPVGDTLLALSRARAIEVRHRCASAYQERPGDVVFLDPPYVGTAGNYGAEAATVVADVRRLVERLTVPVIFAYGTDAPTTFPGLPWEVVKKKQVPRVRTGGTLERIEHVAYLNWPGD